MLWDEIKDALEHLKISKRPVKELLRRGWSGCLCASAAKVVVIGRKHLGESTIVDSFGQFVKWNFLPLNIVCVPYCSIILSYARETYKNQFMKMQYFLKNTNQNCTLFIQVGVF